MFGGSTPDRVRLRLFLAKSHSEVLRCVEEALDWIFQEQSKFRQHKQDMSEDQITVEIVQQLKAMGIQAGHDTDYGGHGDIVVELKNDFLWIGEAKIHRDYDWLLKGFQQLDTRYSTGIAGQDSGGMIIYCYGSRTDQVMERWSDHLVTNRPDVTVASVDGKPLERRSAHIHERTGAQFIIRHTPVSLYFNPKDRPAAASTP